MDPDELIVAVVGQLGAIWYRREFLGVVLLAEQTRGVGRQVRELLTEVET